MCCDVWRTTETMAKNMRSAIWAVYKHKSVQQACSSFPTAGRFFFNLFFFFLSAAAALCFNNETVFQSQTSLRTGAEDEHRGYARQNHSCCTWSITFFPSANLAFFLRCLWRSYLILFLSWDIQCYTCCAEVLVLLSLTQKHELAPKYP